MYTKSLHKVLVLLHELLIQSHHYSMLFGRIHARQRPLLNALPMLTASELKSFLSLWADYAAFAIDAYVQRQLLLHKNTGMVSRVYTSHVGSRVLVAREVLRGIETTTLLHADGTRVSTTSFYQLTVIRAKDRLQLTADNCVLLKVATVPKVRGAKVSNRGPSTRPTKTLLRSDANSKGKIISSVLPDTGAHVSVTKAAQADLLVSPLDTSAELLL